MAQRDRDSEERIDIPPLSPSAAAWNPKIAAPIQLQSDGSLRSLRSGHGLHLGHRVASLFHATEAQTEEREDHLSLNSFDQALMPFMISESNNARKVWEFLLLFVLLYVGIIFPYKLAFVDFRLSTSDEDNCDFEDERDAWYYIEKFVNIFFWIDLFLYFVFTFRTDTKEEFRPSRICVHYLKGFFVINLLACLPSETFRPLLDALNIAEAGGGCASSGTDAESVRILRLQRVTRLARLARLLRLFKIASFLKKSIGQWLLNALRSVRVLNWLVGLLWIVHLMACGWYLCAAMHTEHSITWVGRRPIPMAAGEEEKSLLHEGTFIQWMHASYFVLTVFTTVGFGDMSAYTVGEIAYVCFLMMVGAIVHSIIISEMINLISEVDEGTKWRRGQVKLLKAFAKHAHFREDFTGKITDWIDSVEMGQGSYDREELQRLITSGIFPRRLLGEMPDQLYEGALMKNRFLVTCRSGFRALGSLAPPRFALLLSTMLESQSCIADEVVYQMYDHAFNICLVMSGTFACVAEAGPRGGTDVMLESPEVQGNSWARRARRKRSLTLGATQALGLAKRSGTGNNISDETDQAAAIIVENPEDQARVWSSSSEPRFSSLVGASSAWTPEASDQRKWLQVDLGRHKPVCGVLLQGHPIKEQWVTYHKVEVSPDAAEWFEVLTSRGCHDQETEVENSFAVVQARYVRVIPLNWQGGPSLRMAVLVQSSTLYPYRLFGAQSFFGDEVVLHCQRECTVRCEADGEFLSLQRRDLMPTTGGLGVTLLAEFPQVRSGLVRALRNRRQVRLRMLSRLSTKRSYRHFAAACIQCWYRRMKQAAENNAPQLEGEGCSPARRMQATPSSESNTSDQHPGTPRLDVLQRSAVAREQAMPIRRPSSVIAVNQEASISNPNLADWADRVALERQVQRLSENMVALRADLTGKLDKLTSLLESRG